MGDGSGWQPYPWYEEAKPLTFFAEAEKQLLKSLPDVPMELAT